MSFEEKDRETKLDDVEDEEPDEPIHLGFALCLACNTLICGEQTDSSIVRALCGKVLYTSQQTPANPLDWKKVCPACRDVLSKASDAHYAVSPQCKYP